MAYLYSILGEKRADMRRATGTANINLGPLHFKGENMEFQEFDSIEVLESLVTISEKIHGTNAQIAINDLATEIQAGSRNRWITPEDDNYGFATWVYENKDALITLLGPGRHFGEWYGSGIGPGYGLKEKRFALFNTYR